MLRKTLIILALFGITAAVGNLQAQGVGFGAQAGLHKADSADEGDAHFGALLRAKMGPALAVEGSILYRQDVYNEGALTVRSWPVMASGLIYPVPFIYGLIGAGWYNTRFEYDAALTAQEDRDEQEFGWHFGGGLELPLGALTVTGDIRYVFLNYDFQELPGSPELNSDFFQISVGVLLGLDHSRR